MQNSSQTAAVILAAGTSSRMGEERNKLLLPLHNRPVLAYVIEAAFASQARPILLVLGHQAEQVRASIHESLQGKEIQIVENPDYRQGMSTSMRTGLQALFSQDYKNNLANVIFLLGDQPLMKAALINELITLREKSGKRIVLPLYQGQRGNPVLFSLDFAPELLSVSGDQGGRGLLKRYSEEIAILEINETDTNFDMDTWEAYLEIQASWAKQGQE